MEKDFYQVTWVGGRSGRGLQPPPLPQKSNRVPIVPDRAREERNSSSAAAQQGREETQGNPLTNQLLRSFRGAWSLQVCERRSIHLETSLVERKMRDLHTRNTGLSSEFAEGFI